MPVSFELIPKYGLYLDFSLAYSEKALVLLFFILQLINKVSNEPQTTVTLLIKVG